MDYQVLFNGAVGIAAFLGGWVLNSITKSLDKLGRDMKSLDADVRAMPVNYVSKTDFKDALRDLRDDMHRGFDTLNTTISALFTKLDDKEDKA